MIQMTEDEYYTQLANAYRFGVNAPNIILQIYNENNAISSKELIDAYNDPSKVSITLPPEDK